MPARLFLSLAILVWCAGCVAPGSSDGNNPSREPADANGHSSPHAAVNAAARMPLFDPTALPEQFELTVPAMESAPREAKPAGRHAILVVADKYVNQPGWNPSHTGGLRDKLHAAFTERLAIPPANILEFTGEAVIGADITDAIEQQLVSRISGPANTLLIYWVGGAVTPATTPGESADLRLLTHYAARTDTGTAVSGALVFGHLMASVEKLRVQLGSPGANLRVITVIDGFHVPEIPTGGVTKIATGADAIVLSAAAAAFPPVSHFSSAFCETLAKRTEMQSWELADIVRAAGERMRAGNPNAKTPEVIASDQRLSFREGTGAGLQVQALDASDLTAPAIADATVQFLDTAVDVPAEFRGIDAGRYLIRTRAPGFFWRDDTITIREGEKSTLALGVPLVPQFVLVTGLLGGLPSGAKVKVSLAGAATWPFYRPDVHRSFTGVDADGRFSLAVPDLPADAELVITVDGREVLRLCGFEATKRYLDVPIANAEDAGQVAQRVAQFDFGAIATASPLAAHGVDTIGAGLEPRTAEFPEIAFRETSARTVYALAKSQAHSRLLAQHEIALETLAGLIADNAATTAAGMTDLIELREAVLENYLVKLHAEEPERARNKLRLLLDGEPGASGFTTGRLGAARIQLVRWLAAKARTDVRPTDEFLAPDFAAALAALELATTYATSPALAEALARLTETTFDEWIRGTARVAFSTGDWAAVSAAWRRASTAFPDSDAIARWPSTIRREDVAHAIRQRFAEGEAAFVAGRLAEAEAHYLALMTTANAHYRDLALAQLVALSLPQFEKYFLAGALYQSIGDRSAALDAYLSAFRFRPTSVEPLLRFFDDPSLAPIWQRHAGSVALWDDLKALPATGDAAQRLAAIELLIAKHPQAPLRPAMEIRRQSLRKQFLDSLPRAARQAFVESTPYEQAVLVNMPAADRLAALALPTTPTDLRALYFRAARVPGFTYLRTETFTVAGQTRPMMIYRSDAIARALLLRPDETEVTAEFVLIPNGEFEMGATDADASPGEDEGPRRRVRVGAFLLARTELTIAAWEGLTGQSQPGMDEPRRPIDGVSWEFATRILAENGLRLPSEAEWEFACRAGSQTVFHFGDSPASIGQFAWISSTADRRAHPVAQLLPNGFGLFDMHGNVWEWCADAYHPNYVRAPATAIAWVPRPNEGDIPRVRRGGSWAQSDWYSRAAARMWAPPLAPIADTGIRPAISIPE